MGSAVLKKPPSPFMTFIYCFLLISFLFYIPHRIVAQRVKNGASSVHGSTPGHAPNAVGHGSPPKQNHPNSVAESCGRGSANRNCLPNSRASRINESGEAMYNRTEGVPPSYNRGGGLYTGRH